MQFALCTLAGSDEVRTAMEKWFMIEKGGDFKSIAEKYHISPVLARILCNRGVSPGKDMADYLLGDIERLSDGMLMKDMDKAVKILREAIRDKKRIRIIGDYDIDGVNASYILYEGIRRHGGCVDVDIPERIRDGYGISFGLIDTCISDSIDVIITCDNGIAAGKEIEYAIEHGMTVIVTDHHQIPFIEEGGVKQYMTPPAHAIVNPHRPDCVYPFKELCGAAVAFQLIRVLAKECADSEGAARDVSDLVEHAAIATIGDVMDLVGENRLLAKEGLRRMRRTNNAGLRALMEASGVGDTDLSAYHIGFIIGPCINASGRLDTALRAFSLFCERDPDRAQELAQELVALNEERKNMTIRGVEEAQRQVEQFGMDDDTVFVIYLPDCHESLAGIIAGRIRERFTRPTVVLTKGAEGIKGSARSIEAYDMYAELNKHRELFKKFGGHPMAAGMTLADEAGTDDQEIVGRFRRAINSTSPLTRGDLYEPVDIDMPLSPRYMSEALVNELHLMEPCGKGNTRPLFAQKDVCVERVSVRGQKENVLSCALRMPDGYRCQAVYFGAAREAESYFAGKERIDIVYDGRINEYMGRRTVELRILHYR